MIVFRGSNDTDEKQRAIINRWLDSSEQPSAQSPASCRHEHVHVSRTWMVNIPPCGPDAAGHSDSQLVGPNRSGASGTAGQVGLLPGPPAKESANSAPKHWMCLDSERPARRDRRTATRDSKALLVRMGALWKAMPQDSLNVESLRITKSSKA